MHAHTPLAALMHEAQVLGLAVEADDLMHHLKARQGTLTSKLMAAAAHGTPAGVCVCKCHCLCVCLCLCVCVCV